MASDAGAAGVSAFALQWRYPVRGTLPRQELRAWLASLARKGVAMGQSRRAPPMAMTGLLFYGMGRSRCFDSPHFS
jgi:hypothetical protein